MKQEMYEYATPLSLPLQRIRSTDLHQHVGKRVLLQGWLQNIRRIGGISFILLRDGWGVVQAVSESATSVDWTDLHPESVIEMSGMVVATTQTASGFEIHAPELTILSPVRKPLPILISKREVKASLSKLLDHAALVNRHPARRAIFRLASSVMMSFRDYLTSHDFTEIQTPKIVGSATESGANVFELDYFGQPAFLAQSPQLYKQIMVGVFERVFEVGPVFRAEPHDTARHVNEYVSMDVEMGFIQDHFSLLTLLRALLNYIFVRISERHQEELSLLNINLPAVPEKIPIIHFGEAKELIHQQYSHLSEYVDERKEPDLSPLEERRLGKWAMETYQSDFLAVTGYPMTKRPFYTHPDPADEAYSNSFDLLFRGTELVTGGQRLHLYESYVGALRKAGYAEELFRSYLEAFEYGMPPHGGFAIGLERLLMQLTGASNLRLTTLFPRDMSRVTP